MKKILCMLLVFAMLVSFAACENGGEDIGDTKAPELTSTPTLAADEDADYEFYAGFSRKSINPTEYPILVNYGVSAQRTRKDEELCATSVAVSDGKTKALFITLDLKDIDRTFSFQIISKISSATKVPKNNIFLCLTHTHSAPLYTTNSGVMSRWKKQATAAIVEAAEESIADLTLTEAYTGRANSEGLSFVRRYLLADGTYRGIGIPIEGASNAAIVAHESEADPEMQVIRFVRQGDKKDIVVANWQSHYGESAGDDNISADYIAWFRNGVEKEYDVHCAYYQGAAGNINLLSYVYNKGNSGLNYQKVGISLVKVCGEALNNLTKVNLGAINVEVSNADAKIKVEKDPEREAAAIKIINGEDHDNVLRKQYKFEEYEPGAVYQSYVYRLEHPNGKMSIPVSAISFGDLAFVSAPYEMFDTNGIEIKKGSPFSMTFVCGYSNGYYGYMPSAFAVPHGQYEVYVSYFEGGTAEVLVGEFLNMLEKLYNK